MGTESTSLRTFVGSVVCIDLVGYSKLPVDRQIEVKKRFNQRLMKALARVPTKDRVALDTGDGVLVGFLSDPEQCFATALNIREVIEPGSARIGIHLGSVKLIPGMSGEVRLVGDTANIAERIASLAEPGQIVVSRSFHAMVSRLSDQHQTLFRPAEARIDKQGQEHEIFVVDPPRAKGVAKPVTIGIAALLVLALGAAGAWLALRKPAAQPQPPAIAQKAEPKAITPPRVESPPVAEPPKPAPAPVETKRVPVPRSEAPPRSDPPPRIESRPAEPRTQAEPRSPPPSASASTTKNFLNQGQKLLSTLGAGTADAARTAGSAAGNVFSTVKEKTLGVSAPPAPPPTVLSRAATYFPQEAASQGIRSGKVQARLDVDAAGDVTNVTILSADPPGYFESRRRARSSAGSSTRAPTGAASRPTSISAAETRAVRYASFACSCARSSSCRRHISANRPPCAMSARKGPRSMISPWSMTRISSASTIVDRRWAIASVVWFTAISESSAWIDFSVCESSAEVASSKTRIGGFLRSVRAMETRCFSPPESLRPRSPTVLSHFIGKRSMNSRCARRAPHARPPRASPRAARRRCCNRSCR
jgi:outer membrane biosynthesis protein TonB